MTIKNKKDLLKAIADSTQARINYYWAQYITSSDRAIKYYYECQIELEEHKTA